LLDGAVQLTCAEPDPAIPLTPDGTDGTFAPVGVTALEFGEAAAVPALLDAVTVNV
jgi:hypothetical protein